MERIGLKLPEKSQDGRTARARDDTEVMRNARLADLDPSRSELICQIRIRINN